MARLRRGLVALGLIGALAASSALTAQATLLRTIDLAQEDMPTDVPADMPADVPADMPADAPADVPADAPTDMQIETPTATPTATPTVTATPSPTATPTPNPTAVAKAIQQVLQRSNDEQVQAIVTRNLSITADTLTDAHFHELTSILQDMLNSKVNSIALLKLDWGPVVIAADGTSAVATTYETWRIVSQAGTIDYDPVRNDYTLVLDNAVWKIKSDVLVVGPTPTPVPPH